MDKRVWILTLAVVSLSLGVCCWSMMRDGDTLAPGQVEVERTFRGQLTEYAHLAWGKHNIRLEALTGPENAKTLVLRGADGSCAEPPIRLFILYTFGFIEPIETITCNESEKSISVEVRPYRDKIRATFPMAPNKPDTEIEFGGVVTQMSRDHGKYEKMQFKSRQEIVDYLQIEPRGHQFASPSKKLHKHGLRIYAEPQDDRILIVETSACDGSGYRMLSFSFDGLSKTTMVKWTELGGTYLVCKGTRELGFISMRAAREWRGLHPVNSNAHCTRRRIQERCN